MKLRELFNRQLNEATLRRGSRGEDVKALQRALGIRPADGIFGPQTERAVRNFQKGAGLTVDGLAGGQTQAAIRRYQEEPGASSDYGNIRPGSDWSSLDPGEIEVTPAAAPEAEPEEPEYITNLNRDAAEPAAEPGDAADDGGLGQRPNAAEPEPEPTGSGRGDGGAEVAARREEAARQATEEFVRAQVAELTRIRRNYPEDQLIRKITADAVEQGLNDDWAENGAMAAYIAELVPTVDRAAPEVDTSSPGGLGAAPEIGDNSAATAPGGDAEVDTTAAARPTAPSRDANVDAAQVAQQISRFQQAYGNGTDGQVPTTFRDRFLNPALDTLGSESMKALSDELAGEIPQAVARVIIQRLENVYGNEQELQQAKQEMQSDTDPEIQDQVAALDLLIPLLTKLRRDEARQAESVEFDRILKLAGV